MGLTKQQEHYDLVELKNHLEHLIFTSFLQISMSYENLKTPEMDGKLKAYKEIIDYCDRILKE